MKSSVVFLLCALVLSVKLLHYSMLAFSSKRRCARMQPQTEVLAALIQMKW